MEVKTPPKKPGLFCRMGFHARDELIEEVHGAAWDCGTVTYTNQKWRCRCGAEFNTSTVHV